MDRSPRHWLVALGGAMLMMALAVMNAGFSFLNAPLAAHLGAQVSAVVVYFSIFIVVGGAVGFFSGPIVSRFGARRVVVIGGLWSVALLAAFPSVDSLAMLYGLAGLLGLTFALCTAVMASVLVNTWFATRRGTVQGIVMSFSGVGGIILGLVMPAVIAAWGWEGGFRLLAAYVALTVVLPGIVLIRSTPASAGLLPYGATRSAVTPAAGVSTAPAGAVRAAVRSPRFIAILAAMVLVNGLTTFQQHLPLILATDGIAPAAAGTLVSALALSMLLAKLVVGVLDDFRGTVTAMWTALALFACGLFVLAAGSGYLPSLLGLLLAGFGLSGGTVLLPLVLTRAFGRPVFSTLWGPMLAAGSLGLAVMMPLWGLAYESTGSFTLPLAVAGVVTLAVALALHWALTTSPGDIVRPRAEDPLQDERIMGP